MGGTRGASSGNDERFTQALARGFVFLSRGEFVRQTSIITLTERHRVSARVNDGMRRRAVRSSSLFPSLSVHRSMVRLYCDTSTRLERRRTRRLARAFP